MAEKNRSRLSPSTPRSRGMDKYEQLTVVGEGSYGVVLKCRRRDTGDLVAIKKFLETEEDAGVRKMALREIRMLKKLHHEHLVNMIEVFRRKRRYYLVFEYLDHTLLDELESSPGGLGEETARKHLYQLLKGIEYCHVNSVIHRDVKPENVLVSKEGIVKLCDLGFARALAAPGEPYTEYVATRWYRAPELLVAEHRYGPEVDIWAIGCLFAEMLTGDPLFPGDSDIDQLALIINTVGKLAPRHQQIVSRLSSGALLNVAGPRGVVPGTARAKDLLAACLRTEPRARPSATVLLRHKYFVGDGFADNFNAELREKLGKQVLPSQPIRPTSRPRHQWTLNIQENKPACTENVTNSENLINYNFLPGTEIPIEKSVNNLDSIYNASSTAISGGGEMPTTTSRPSALKTLSKNLNDTFQTLPVPLSCYPKTPYIKKINKSLIIDEELLGRDPTSFSHSKKSMKKIPCDFSLPNVYGATNSPMKRARKPNNPLQKYLDTWNSRGANFDASTSTNLPYVFPDEIFHKSINNKLFYPSKPR